MKYGTGFLIEAKYVAKTSSNFIIEILLNPLNFFTGMRGMPEQSFNQQRWPSCRRWGPEMFCLISRSFYTQKCGPPALGLQRAHPGAAEQAGARRSSDFNQLSRWGQFFQWLKNQFWFSKNVLVHPNDFGVPKSFEDHNMYNFLL